MRTLTHWRPAALGSTVVLIFTIFTIFTLLGAAQQTPSPAPQSQQTDPAPQTTQPTNPPQTPSAQQPTAAPLPQSQPPASNQTPQPGNSPQMPPSQQPSPAPQQGPPAPAAPPQQSAPKNDQTQPSASSPMTAQPQGGDQEGMFVFKKQVDEVVLHATVVDERRRLVAHLDRNDFAVFEDGMPQNITSFRREDIPVAIGIAIDNSGSMRDKRAEVSQAVLNLIRASNPQDQVFIVNFSKTPYLDQDFTSDISLLEASLHQTSTEGSTALYDAIVASAVHLKNNPQLEKRILLVITDGQDNMSENTLQEAARALQQSNGPVLYAIGLMGPSLQSPGHDALQKLADVTGGAAYFPASLDQVSDITRSLAHDIRSQYTIAYKPQNQNMNAQYHPIRVEARAPGYGRLLVHTRSGIYTGESVR